MEASDFYYRKFIEWEHKADKDYREYILGLGATYEEKINKLASEFRSDKDFKLVCQYLDKYAKGKNTELISDIIGGIESPERDILEIIIGATLDACGKSKNGDALVGLAIVSLIGAALLALFATLGKD